MFTSCFPVVEQHLTSSGLTRAIKWTGSVFLPLHLIIYNYRADFGYRHKNDVQELQRNCPMMKTKRWERDGWGEEPHGFQLTISMGDINVMSVSQNSGRHHSDASPTPALQL
ncbi:hypothetical protein J6590_012298 [Homalodisca vitripennis]|nr:hypothetical protein J6590_012298 [Homalodisca vitripennis]